MSANERRWPRRLAALVIGFGATAMGVAGAALWFATTEAGNRALLGILGTHTVQGQLLREGHMEAGGLSTDLLGHLVLDDVVLRDGTGRAVMAADRIVLRYDGWGFLRGGAGRLHVHEVSILGPAIDLAVDAEGRLDLARMFGSDSTAPSAPFELPFALDVDRVAVVGGRFAMAGGPRVEGVSLFGQVHGAGARVEVTDLAAQAVVTGPFALPAVLRGGLAYTGDTLELSGVHALAGQSRFGVDGQLGLGGPSLVKVGIDLGRLHLADLERFTGPLALQGDVAGHLDAIGPLALVAVQGQLDLEEPARGSAAVTAIVAATSPGTPWWAALRVDDLHVEDVVGTVPVVVALDGRLDVAGRGAAFPGDLVAAGRFVGDTQQVDTLTLDHLDAPLRLEGGVLRWTDAAATSSLGPLRAEGQLDLVSGALATDVRGPVALGGLAMFGLEGTGGGGSSLVRVTGNVFADDLPLDATATIAWAPLIYGDDVRFERADGVVRWSMRDGVQHADGDLVLRGGRVYGATVARLALPDLAVDLPPDGTILLGGTADAVKVAYGDTAEVDTASGAWTARLPPAGDPVVHAQLAVGPVVAVGFPASGGAVAVDYDGGVVRADVHLIDGDRDFLVVAPTFEVATGRLTAPALFVSPTHRQAWVSDGPVAMTVTDGGVADAHLALVSALGRVVVWGDFDPNAPLMGHIEAEGLELDVFAELFPEQAGDLAGKLTLVADVAGTSASPVFDATVDATGLFLPGVSRWMDVSGTFAGDAAGVSVRADVGVAGAPLGQIVGRIPAHLDLSDPRPDLDGPLDVSIDIVQGPLSRIADVYADAPALPDGLGGGHLVASGTLRDPVFSADLDLSLLVPGWKERAEVALDLTRRGEVLTIGVNVDEGAAPRLIVAGTARTRVGAWIAYALGEGPAPDATDAGLLADAMVLRVDAPGWPLKSLFSLQGYDPSLVTGDLVAGFDVTGTFTQPVFDGRFDIATATLVDVRIKDAALVLKPGRAGYAVDGVFGLDDDTLRVAGRVPMAVDLTKDFAAWFDEDLDLTVDGSMPLALVHVADPRFRGQGKMTLRGRITGRLDDPWPDLDAQIAKGRVASASVGVEFHNIALDAHLDPTRLHVRSFSADSAPVQDALGRVLNPTEGRIEGAIDLGLAAWAPTTVDGWLELDRTWLASSPKLTARMSGRIDAFGDGVGPVSVVGSLAVDEAHYLYDADASLSRPILLDPRITVHRAGDAAPAPRALALATASIWSNVRVAVAIELARAVEVDGTLVAVGDYGVVGAGLSRADFDVRVDSRDLRLEVDRGELGLVGEVEIVNGEVIVLGRPFVIGESHAAFLGDPYEPQLAVNASTDVQGAGIELAVTGTPSRPKMELSSEDFANDPTSMITALVSGQRPENLANGAGAGAANALLGLGLSNVIGALGGKLGNLANIQADGTVHVVTRLGPRVRLEGVVDPLPSTNQNAYGAQVEITPFPHVLFKGVYGDEQQWMDLYWETRF